MSSKKRSKGTPLFGTNTTLFVCISAIQFVMEWIKAEDTQPLPRASRLVYLSFGTTFLISGLAAVLSSLIYGASVSSVLLCGLLIFMGDKYISRWAGIGPDDDGGGPSSPGSRPRKQKKKALQRQLAFFIDSVADRDDDNESGVFDRVWDRRFKVLEKEYIRALEEVIAQNKEAVMAMNDSLQMEAYEWIEQKCLSRLRRLPDDEGRLEPVGDELRIEIPPPFEEVKDKKVRGGLSEARRNRFDPLLN